MYDFDTSISFKKMFLVHFNIESKRNVQSVMFVLNVRLMGKKFLLLSIVKKFFSAPLKLFGVDFFLIPECIG